MTPTDIEWPADLQPGKVPVYSYNELEIAAAPDVVWAWLIRAESWPEWYPNCKDLRFLGDNGPNLGSETEFTWKTFGVRVKTKVAIFVPNEKLAWRGTGLGASGFHSWVIEPTSGGCKVVTEEVQSGLVPFLLRFIFQRLLVKYHQIWLQGLAEKAQGGLPEHQWPRR